MMRRTLIGLAGVVMMTFLTGAVAPNLSNKRWEWRARLDKPVPPTHFGNKPRAQDGAVICTRTGIRGPWKRKLISSGNQAYISDMPYSLDVLRSFIIIRNPVYGGTSVFTRPIAYNPDTIFDVINTPALPHVETVQTGVGIEPRFLDAVIVTKN